MKKLYALFFFLCMYGMSYAQQEVVINGESINVEPGLKGEVVFTVDGYVQVDFCTFSMKFDPAVVSLDTILFSGQIPLTEIDLTEIELGHVGITLSSFFSPGPTLDNGSTLMTMRFTAIGFNGNSSTVVVHDSPKAIGGISGVQDVNVSIGTNGVVNIGTPDAILEKGINQSFKIYPNPASDYAIVQLESLSAELVIIRVMDVSGRQYVKYQTNANQLNIDLSNYPAGIYFVSVAQGQKLFTQRLLIQ